MGWRDTFFRVTYLFTKAKVDDADAIGAPEIKKNDEKSVVQGGPRTAEPTGRGKEADASVAAPELKIDVLPVCTSSADMANDLSAAEKFNDDDAGVAPDQQRRTRQRILATTTSGSGGDSTPTPWHFRHLCRRLVARSWIHEIRRAEGQSTTTSTKRQRLHELAKKTIPLKSVLLAALFAYEPSYSRNMWFMMSLQACILSVLIDILSAVTLINLANPVPVCWHCFLACFSGIFMTLVPYFLLISMDKLSAYVILAVPLPVTVVALVNYVWAPADKVDDDDDALDHVFDVSSAVTNVAVGGGLTGTLFGYNMISQQTMVVVITAGPLGFLLFFTISLGVYLMLVAAVRPKALTRHAVRLVHILLVLLAATALVAAVEFGGWWLAFTVASIDVIEAAVSAVLAKVHGAGAARASTSDAAGRKNEQRLTSIVIATVLFTLVMQLHSQKAGDSPAQYEVLRMLLYFAAFLWSFNRMLFFYEELASGEDGGGAAGVCAWMWSAVQLMRTTVVVLAVLDHVYHNY